MLFTAPQSKCSSFISHALYNAFSEKCTALHPGRCLSTAYILPVIGMSAAKYGSECDNAFLGFLGGFFCLVFVLF